MSRLSSWTLRTNHSLHMRKLEKLRSLLRRYAFYFRGGKPVNLNHRTRAGMSIVVESITRSNGPVEFFKLSHMQTVVCSQWSKMLVSTSGVLERLLFPISLSVSESDLRTLYMHLSNSTPPPIPGVVTNLEQIGTPSLREGYCSFSVSWLLA